LAFSTLKLWSELFISFFSGISSKKQNIIVHQEKIQKALAELLQIEEKVDIPIQTLREQLQTLINQEIDKKA
jgi:hypothetical protein